MARQETADVVADDRGPLPGRPAAAGSLRRGVRLLLVLAVVVAGIIAVAGQWSEVKDSIGRLSIASVMISALCVLGGTTLSMLAWRAILADLGSSLSARTSARIFFVGQLGKYVPGSVWPLVAQMELARDHGVPRRRAGAAYALTMLLILAAGLFAAATALPFVAEDTVQRYGWLVLLAPLILVALHARIVNPVRSWLFRTIRREPPERPLTFRGVASGFGLAVGAWVFLGLHIAVLVVDFGVGAGRAITVSTGAFALAWCAGLLIVFLPAGAGAREVALVAALAPVLDRSEAIVVALVSRLLMTLGDLVLAGIAAGFLAGVRARWRGPT